jgi:hypothetical protein
MDGPANTHWLIDEEHKAKTPAERRQRSTLRAPAEERTVSETAYPG